MAGSPESGIPLLSAAEQQRRPRPSFGSEYFRVDYGGYEYRGPGDKTEIGDRVIGRVSRLGHPGITTLPLPFAVAELCEDEVGGADLIPWRAPKDNTNEGAEVPAATIVVVSVDQLELLPRQLPGVRIERSVTPHLAST